MEDLATRCKPFIILYVCVLYVAALRVSVRSTAVYLISDVISPLFLHLSSTSSKFLVTPQAQAIQRRGQRVSAVSSLLRRRWRKAPLKRRRQEPPGPPEPTARAGTGSPTANAETRNTLLYDQRMWSVGGPFPALVTGHATPSAAFLHPTSAHSAGPRRTASHRPTATGRPLTLPGQCSQISRPTFVGTRISYASHQAADHVGHSSDIEDQPTPCCQSHFSCLTLSSLSR